jgi:hypothetical protein
MMKDGKKGRKTEKGGKDRKKGESLNGEMEGGGNKKYCS